MTVLVGDGFYLPTALGAAGTAAQGTVLTASDLGQVFSIQTNNNLTDSNTTMNAGDGFVVDTDDDGDFTDEAATTQTDNDRYTNSTITFTDGSTASVTLELITLSNGTQAILVNDGTVNDINSASAEISSITLGTFNTTFNDRYSQANFNNTITNKVVCFCDTTLVRTPTGDQKIGTLQAGDSVMTARDGAQKVVWIGKHQLSSAQLIASPHLKPVRICAGALGAGIPHSDLLVSPQHRILLVSKIAERMFGQKEVFVHAIKLVEAAGIEQVTSVAPVTYVHILFETHQVVFANGALAESLYTGPHTLQALNEAARSEIMAIFPVLTSGCPAAPLAHPTVQKPELLAKLLQRHRKNNKPLVAYEASALVS